jgi:hypothetical protein
MPAFLALESHDQQRSDNGPHGSDSKYAARTALRRTEDAAYPAKRRVVPLAFGVHKCR